MSPREVDSWKRGVTIAVVILLAIFILSVLLSWPGRMEIDPGFPYS